MTKEFKDLPENERQELGRKLVGKEIYHSANQIVCHVIEMDDDHNWLHLNGSDDYEEAVAWEIHNTFDKETLIEELGNFDIDESIDLEEMSKEDLQIKLESQIEQSEEQGDTRAWQSIADSHSIDPHFNEVYEHWIVSDWLARKLVDHCEIVENDFHGLTIWGRTCTGQAIALDRVIQIIAFEIYGDN